MKHCPRWRITRLTLVVLYLYLDKTGKKMDRMALCMNFNVVKCSYCVTSTGSHYVRSVFLHSALFHTAWSEVLHTLLKVVWENAACMKKVFMQ